jgi:hypothetical protein
MEIPLETTRLQTKLSLLIGHVNHRGLLAYLYHCGNHIAMSYLWVFQDTH